MEFLPISFIAGVLTVLAPCILPLLPVIIGGSLTDQNKKRPLIITASLALSIVVFTLLLKATTAFITIPQSFWTWFSASIIFIFAITLLFPNLLPKLTHSLKKRFKLEGKQSKAQKLLFKFHNKKGFWPAVVLGGALGPVFASCSPTYFLILGTVLPSSFFVGLVNLLVYSLGLALVMFIIAYAGQKFTKTLNVAANPNGWFKKILGILFLVVALGIATGYDKKFEAYILDQGYFDITKVEQRILDNKEAKDNPISETAEPVMAPDLLGLDHWMNSEGYSSLSELTGKVVLIDFWTYSCINCIRTIPHIQDWHDKYVDDGLVILALHAPEFAFERLPENVANAIDEYEITYPVALDNDFATWNNYKNRFWPAKYLIDKEGKLIYSHFGEGAYDETESKIVELLDAEFEESSVASEEVDFDQINTRETYLGTSRRANYNSNKAIEIGEWSIEGSWREDNEKIYTETSGSELHLVFDASKANLVMGGSGSVDVYVDEIFSKTITLGDTTLYRLFESQTYSEHTLRLEFQGERMEAFAFTFG